MRRLVQRPFRGALSLNAMLLLLLLATTITVDASKRRKTENPQAPILSSPPQNQYIHSSPALIPRSHNFTLRHIFHHGTYQYPHLHKRLDVREYDELWTEGDEQSAVAGRRSFQAVSRAEPIQRLSDRSIQTVEDLVNKRQSQGDTLRPRCIKLDHRCSTRSKHHRQRYRHLPCQHSRGRVRKSARRGRLDRCQSGREPKLQPLRRFWMGRRWLTWTYLRRPGQLHHCHRP